MRKTFLVTVLGYLICTVFGLLSCLSFADSEYKIKLVNPVFVVPQFSGEFRKREASISPDEYELAEQLKALIKDGQVQQALGLLEGYMGIELSPALLLLRAQMYFQLEMWDDAEFNYQLLLDRMPQLVRAHADLGQFYLVQDKFDLARQHFARAVELGSNDAIVHGQLGYLNLKLHNAFSAIPAYQTAVSLEPENVQWQQGLLTAMTEAHMYESALALADQMIAQQPEEGAFWLMRASLYTRVDNLPEALVSLETALRLNNYKEVQNIETASQLHLQLGSYDRGIALMSMAMERTGLNMVTFEKALSWLMLKGFIDQADKLLKNISQHTSTLTPVESSIYYRYKAKVAAQKNQSKAAKSYYQKSLEEDPANGLALIDFAEYLREQKAYDLAEVHYMRAQAMEKYRSLALRGRARINIDRHNYEQALELLETLFRLQPQDSDLKQNIEVLQNVVRNTRNQ